MSPLVLVIEDNPSDQEVFQLFNDRLGAPLQLIFFLIPATTFYPATYHLPYLYPVLMDWNMPGISGQALLVELRKRFAIR